MSLRRCTKFISQCTYRGVLRHRRLRQYLRLSFVFFVNFKLFVFLGHIVCVSSVCYPAHHRMNESVLFVLSVRISVHVIPVLSLPSFTSCIVHVSSAHQCPFSVGLHRGLNTCVYHASFEFFFTRPPAAKYRAIRALLSYCHSHTLIRRQLTWHCLRRCCFKPTAHCNKSRDPLFLRRKLRPALRQCGYQRFSTSSSYIHVTPVFRLKLITPSRPISVETISNTKHRGTITATVRVTPLCMERSGKCNRRCPESG